MIKKKGRYDYLHLHVERMTHPKPPRSWVLWPVSSPDLAPPRASTLVSQFFLVFKLDTCALYVKP